MRLAGKDTLLKTLFNLLDPLDHNEGVPCRNKSGISPMVCLVVALPREWLSNTFEQGNLEKDRACILVACCGKLVSKQVWK